MQDKKRRVRIKTSAKDLGTVLSLLNVNEEVNVEVEVSVEDCKNTYKILNAPAVLDWDFLEEKESASIKEGWDEPEVEKLPEEKCSESIEYSEVMKEVRAALKNAGYEGVDEMSDEEIEREMMTLCRAKDTLGIDFGVKKEEEEGDKFYFPSHKLIDDTFGLIKTIESIWVAAQLSPNVRFGTRLFENNFRKAWNNITVEENTKTDLNHSTTRAMMKLLVDVFYNSPTTEDELATAYYDTLERIKENFNSLKSAETLNQVMNILYRHESKKI
jgi:hypothetical protein